jgi:hypothetical protein
MTGSVFTREAYKQAFLKMKASRSGPEPSLIVEIASYQLALCWLDSGYWDAFFYTQAHGDDLQAIDHYDRRRARAARRLARSIRVYADVVKIGKEAVSVRLRRIDLVSLVST